MTVAEHPVEQGLSSKSRLLKWRDYAYQVVGAEVSQITSYYDKLIQWRPRTTDHGLLLRHSVSPVKEILSGDEPFPDLQGEKVRRTAILLNGTLNHTYDCLGVLSEIRPRLSRNARVLAVIYNPYFKLVFTLANRLGIRQGEPPTTFITERDLHSLAALSGYDVVRIRPSLYLPWKLLGLGVFLNWILPLVPVLRWLALTCVAVLRPVVDDSGRSYSLSVVIPARNEKGNIESAVKRLPEIKGDLEVLFVEGHSTDGTWEEIQRVAAQYSDHFRIKTLQQKGEGKSDAVRLGFSEASGDLLTILDADLTVPPELLTRFYEAYVTGKADFINGNRLMYPMEGEAMRFLNRLGNVFFAKALSWVLSSNISDSLCGTKLLARHDYERMTRWRKDFGDFDPFGDFEMIFPAVTMGLGLMNVPIRYLDRTYGATNIRRFHHGWMLAKMTMTGVLRIKAGAAVHPAATSSREEEAPL